MSPLSFGTLVRLDNFHLQDTTKISLKASFYILCGETISKFANKNLKIMEMLPDKNFLLTNSDFLSIAYDFH